MSSFISDFKIIEVDRGNGSLVVEDEDFGLQITIPIDGNHLAFAQIVCPYEIELLFKDSTSKVVKFLE